MNGAEGWIIVECRRNIAFTQIGRPTFEADPDFLDVRQCHTARIFRLRGSSYPSRLSFVCHVCSTRHTTRSRSAFDFKRTGHRGGGIAGSAVWGFSTIYEAHSDALDALNERRLKNPNIRHHIYQH